MEKKCNWCDATTKSSHEDFHDIGWSGFQLGRNKMVCSCPVHTLEFRKEIIKQVTHKETNE